LIDLERETVAIMRAGHERYQVGRHREHRLGQRLDNREV